MGGLLIVHPARLIHHCRSFRRLLSALIFYFTCDPGDCKVQEKDLDSRAQSAMKLRRYKPEFQVPRVRSCSVQAG